MYFRHPVVVPSFLPETIVCLDLNFDRGDSWSSHRDPFNKLKRLGDQNIELFYLLFTVEVSR